jgi:hypothetical protein
MQRVVGPFGRNIGEQAANAGRNGYNELITRQPDAFHKPASASLAPASKL